MSDAPALLTVQGLSKRYRKFTALSDLSFAVTGGEIVGLLGPNGAGKTTALRCISGVVRPSAGRILVGGYDLGGQEREAKRLLAFVPEQPNPYEMLTVWEHLKFVALAYNTMDGFEERAGELLARFDLTPKRNELVGALSKGMRQKLTIACAFLHRARVLLFDEPLIGLDPKGARELRERIRDARDEGAAVLVSTHMLDTAQKLCDRILILRQGHKLAEGTLQQLQDHAHASGDATLEDVFLTLTAEGGAGDPAAPAAVGTINPR
uniref:ABC transporter, ATP-binding protein n=1 Tax=uncultured Armatimonadetes bacterium TaxID=157466 RepID=A0A6J4IDA0_9BACT|nr:ABC transporter, ATP-binding protein [uncultured Armatimonadetes bacterium]